MIADTENFLQLSFATVSKILSGSSLHVTSETEVFSALVGWLGRDFDKRKPFASDLVPKVRFCLIPDSSLERLLRESTSLPAAPVEKRALGGGKRSRFRYCDAQFNVLVCGGHDGRGYSAAAATRRPRTKSTAPT